MVKPVDVAYKTPLTSASTAMGVVAPVVAVNFKVSVDTFAGVMVVSPALSQLRLD